MEIILTFITVVFFVYVLWVSIGIYADYKVYRKVRWYSKFDALKRALQNVDFY